jgi:hypothetical protein
MKMRSTLVTAALLCLVAGNALAQQKQHVSYKVPPENNKYTQNQLIDVGDIPDHFVRSFELHSTLPANAATINGLKLVETWSRGTADVTEGHGTAAFYIIYVMENGDKAFARAATIIQPVSGKSVGTVTGRIIGGTGKLAGIQGNVRVLATFDPRSGFNEHTGDIDYTVAQQASGGTAQGARAMLDKAVAAVKADRDVALAMFNKGEGGFLQGDLYPFCYRMTDGKAVAGGVTANGADLRTVKDAVGKASGLEIYAGGQKPEGQITEVTYVAAKFGTTEPVFPKVSFVTRVSDLVCGVGYYK